ncbi:MAG TPA: TIGR03621 family F420-dependent LLM class oxidoreductase [Thermomicrobiales bacterium]|nr:TIGR03621 family F420-dependent LLM class oxidoreductase [Thermomicrobiales bacterium]
MTGQRPFRFATSAFDTPTAADLTEAARRIEHQGYALFVVPDHFNNRLAPGPALTAVACAAPGLRVATTVYAADFRHPAVLAKEASSIDVLTDGRFEFGIGAGWARADYDETGIPFDRASVRVRRTQEVLRVVKGLWRDAPFTFDGEFFTIRGLDGRPKPVQQPHPPIFIGGGGRQMLSFAAREANIIGLIARALPDGGLDFAADSEQLLETKLGWVRDAAGERFEQIELAILLWKVVVTDNGRVAAEDAARKRNVTVEQVLRSPYFQFGSVDCIVDRLTMLRDTYGISHVSVFPDDSDAFAPVVARLAGS